MFYLLFCYGYGNIITEAYQHTCQYVHRPMHLKVLLQEFLRFLIQFVIFRTLSVLIYIASKGKVTLCKQVNV